MNATQTTASSKKGATQAHAPALRRSVKVFDGAMKVLTMRAPAESGADSGVGTGDAGRTGAAAMNASLRRFDGILVRGGPLHKPDRWRSRWNCRRCRS